MTAQIKYDRRNFRLHPDRNKELIARSLEDCGAGRSILVDADDEIIAGNGVYEQAQKQGLPVRVVETDGSELVVVKRTDITTFDPRRTQLAVMDNSTSDTSVFDNELLLEALDLPTLEDWGLDMELPDPVDITASNGKNEKPAGASENNDAPLECPRCGFVLDD